MKQPIFALSSALIVILTFYAISSQFQEANSQTVPSGDCDCILDNTTYASAPVSNLTGLTVPSVKLLKNEMVVSQTEGNLSWITEKGTELLGMLSDDFFLGNFSRGTGKTVALNMLNVQQNESLGLEITGGTLPDHIKAELMPASVDRNGTLAEITTTGPKIEVPILTAQQLQEPGFDNNDIVAVNLPGVGDYLLLIELSYDSKIASSNPLALVYETVLVTE